MQAEPRNHPLLLLSGLATNAIGYDLSPEVMIKQQHYYVNQIIFVKTENLIKKLISLKIEM